VVDCFSILLGNYLTNPRRVPQESRRSNRSATTELKIALGQGPAPDGVIIGPGGAPENSLISYERPPF
jgi:hypothetical protein